MTPARPRRVLRWSPAAPGRPLGARVRPLLRDDPTATMVARVALPLLLTAPGPAMWRQDAIGRALGRGGAGDWRSARSRLHPRSRRAPMGEAQPENPVNGGGEA